MINKYIERKADVDICTGYLTVEEFIKSLAHDLREAQKRNGMSAGTIVKFEDNDYEPAHFVLVDKVEKTTEQMEQELDIEKIEQALIRNQEEMTLRELACRLGKKIVD